jgi:hypothetical protein
MRAKAHSSERVIYAARKRAMNEKENAMGKCFIVGSDGSGSDAFESFSRAVDMLLCIVADVKIHLAGGSVSYWIEGADGVPLTEKLPERRDQEPQITVVCGDPPRASQRASHISPVSIAGSASQEIAAAAAEAVSTEIEQEIAVLSERMRFAQKYSAAKGWKFANLKGEQMLEIRDQEGWRTPALPAANAA